MVATKYEILGKESTRLLTEQKKLLSNSLKVYGLFSEKRKEQYETYNFKEVEQSIKEIENEIDKLVEMETVIAVVGTMKAGKSTTINAIVGKEVLPNRNDPMTTLPTLIRNKHGQVEPILTLNDFSTLTSLTVEIAKILKGLKNKKQLSEVNPPLYGTNDGKELINMLLDEEQFYFKKFYEGQGEIFSFLRHLNDLMRLAKEIGVPVDSIYENYQNGQQLPTIDVEFCHLQSLENAANGNLSILDTPGPNEFGQSASLKAVFKQQLKRATSVMLVIDYTQMKSEAESAVREQIESIKKQLDNERLSILVNKFDNSNSNSMQKEDVKAYVANTLMDDSSLKSRVFPVSAWEAFLANRVLNHLEQENVLPLISPDERSWVIDFAEIALGKRWKKRINDIEEVTESANELWQDSFFQEPLDNVIKDSHAKAEILCVNSAIAKMGHIQEIFGNTVFIRLTSLNKEIMIIQQAISILEKEISDLELLKDEINKLTEDFIDDAEKDLSTCVDKHNEALKQVFTEIFKKGEDTATTAIKNRKEEKVATMSNTYDLRSFLNPNRLKKRIKILNEKYKYSRPEEGIVKFDNQQDAVNLLKIIETESKTSIKEYENSINNTFEEIIINLSNIITKAIDVKIKNALEKAKEKLGGTGFDITISLNSAQINLKTFELSELLDGAYNEETTSEYSKRRKTSLWGGFCGWWGTSDWGWESYTVEKKEYSVNLHEIYDCVIDNLERETQQTFNMSCKQYLKKDIQPFVNQHLSDLGSYLEQYKGVLIDGEKSSRELEKGDAEKLKHELKIIKDEIYCQSNDLNVIKKMIVENIHHDSTE